MTAVALVVAMAAAVETSMAKVVAYTFPNAMVLFTNSSLDNNRFITFFRAAENVTAYLDDYDWKGRQVKAIYSDEEGATILKLKYPTREDMYTAMHKWYKPTRLPVS